MNPLRIARIVRDDYLTLLRTTFSPRQERLRNAFNTEIERDGFLTREPFISLAQPYRTAGPLTALAAEVRRRFGPIAESPFEHQAQATRRIAAGQPTIVATGTGSGKTEAFLIPIIDRCYLHRAQPGTKAVLIYPMNALATDQLRRVRALLAGSGVSFGRYTGETSLSGQRPDDAPVEERTTRVEFRQNPPHILLTNYQMLEYMLLRGDGRDIFRNHRIRFVVLDEVHTYHGALGTDVACLLRRLRASFAETNAADGPPLFIGTSATLQSGETTADPREGVARFFTRLTGQDTSTDSVITETYEPPQPPTSLRLGPVPDVSEDEVRSFDSGRPEIVSSLVRKLAGVPSDDARNVEAIWEQMRLPYLLLNWLRRPRPIQEVVHELAAQPERSGVDPDTLRREIEAALLLGPCLPDQHFLRLRPRVHRFLRGLARFWRCTNSDCGRLMGEGIDTCSECGSRTMPLAICRTCGWDFFVGREVEGQVTPWSGRTSTQRTVYYYDPPRIQIEADTEENPLGGEEDNPGEQAEDGAAVADTTPARDADEDEDEQELIPDAQAYLCPQCLGVSDSPAHRSCTCANGPLRPVRMHRGRGNRCPVCSSRYGRFDVLTPVSLGNSSALTHVSRTLLRELPEGNKKILVFCDSRQDAAHQARFIEGIEGHLRLRRAVFQALSQNPGRHDLHWLSEEIYHRFIAEGYLRRTRSRDAIQREMDKIDGSLLSEFVLAANVRSSLERLGLVTVRYAGLDDELNSPAFNTLCAHHNLDLADTQIAVRRLLDFMRQHFAITHDIFRNRLRSGDRLSSRFGITPGRQVGLPVAFLRPGNSSHRSATYKLISVWNLVGVPAGAQKLWRRLLGQQASAESLAGVLEWLENEQWLVWSGIGENASQAEGYQIEWGVLEFEQTTRFARCNICGRVAPGDNVGQTCPRPGCEGLLVTWVGPIAEGNLNATLITSEYSPALKPAEHSAAVSDDIRAEVERGFQENPPAYNVLVCTPTLELGVNIGDLEAVSMRNVPPSPANYAQRAGRTGRRSRMGMAVGFARNTPHDGYFFDHPAEVIVGAIPPPRFNMANLQAVARHIHSLVLQEARLDVPANLEGLISEDGSVNAGNLQTLLSQISQVLPRAAQLARTVFSAQLPEIRPDWERWLDRTVAEVPDLLRSTIETRAALIENSVNHMRQLGQQVRQTQRERDAEQAYRNLAVKLRVDYRYAYLPRVLAEAGVLPGYSFPGDPGSLSLAYDPEPVFAGRLQAQREYAPGQIVYARGHRWRVSGVAMNRPGAASRNRGAERFDFTECLVCGLANPASGANNCFRCGSELSGPSITAWDTGAFQAFPAEVEPETEEERSSVGFDVRVHPQRNVASQNFTVGDWCLELRQQEEIWWINHGPMRAGDDGPAGPTGFRLCPRCGELRPDPRLQQEHNRRGQQNRDARADRDPHDERCGGVPANFVLGHQDNADTLRLIVPGIASLGDEGVGWGWSLGSAVVQGAVRMFEIDEDDIEVRVLTRKLDRHEEVLEIIWVDTTLGGSGILDEIARRFSDVARAASQHLNGHDCPSSCYRCLRSYRNQRVHGLLNWRLIYPQLLNIGDESMHSVAGSAATRPTTEGPDWDEARRNGCGSPLEHRLLLAIRAAGLPEPEKQFTVEDRPGHAMTVADFAYPNRSLLIYVDGLAFHSSLRMRLHDTRQSNRLQTMGFRVLRFLGTRLMRSAPECVAEIEAALVVPSSIGATRVH